MSTSTASSVQGLLREEGQRRPAHTMALCLPEGTPHWEVTPNIWSLQTAAPGSVCIPPPWLPPPLGQLFTCAALSQSSRKTCPETPRKGPFLLSPVICIILVNKYFSQKHSKPHGALPLLRHSSRFLRGGWAPRRGAKERLWLRGVPPSEVRGRCRAPRAKQRAQDQTPVCSC